MAHTRYPISIATLQNYLKELAPLKDVFDLAPDHVVITDENANILYANKVAVENTGFTPEEMIGRNPGDLWGGQMPKEFYEKMWHTIKVEKKPFVGEVQNQRKDKKDYWQELHIAPVLDRDGNVKFFIGIEPNITDRKRLEKLREEFISILGHQLRDPLAAINWTLEFLLQTTGLPGSQQNALKEIYKGTTDLAALISDLLALVRIGRVDMKKDKIDLGAEIEGVIRQVKKANPKVAITFQKDGKDFPLITNKSLANQVFTNLISNAAEYSDKKYGQAHATLKKEGDNYIFTSENNGEPIPSADQPKIYGKLFRGSNASKMKERGTGLGLFIVKMICDHFGWKTYFESPAQGDKGAKFFVVMKIN